MKKPVRLLTPLVFAVLLGSLFLVLWPLMKSGFFVTDDGEWMVIRLSAFYQSLAQGQFPVRFLGRLNNSYGYPVATFLYPGYLYIGSVLRLIGLSYVDAVKLIMGASVVGTAIFTYIALRAKYSLRSSLIATLGIVFAPYLLFDLYRRGSVGEVLAMFAGAVAIAAVRTGRAWLLAPAIAMLILSHNTVALIAGLAIAVLILFTARRNRMVVSYALGIGAAAFFWLPAVLERRFVRFDAVAVSDPSRYFITPENAVLLGVPTVIALVMLLAVKGRNRAGETASAVIAAAGMAVSLPIAGLLWQGPLLSRLVQFPYRFLVLPVLFGPFIMAAVLEHLRGARLLVFTVLTLALWGIGAAAQLSGIRFVNRPDGYYVTNEGTTNVANEYMPKWVHDVPKTRPAATLEIIDGDATLSRQVFAGENIRAVVEAKEVSTLQINKVYYPGWGVTLNNRLVPVNYGNVTGVMRVEIPSGTHIVAASFRETPFRFITDLISLASVICYAILFSRLRKTT